MPKGDFINREKARIWGEAHRNIVSGYAYAENYYANARDNFLKELSSDVYITEEEFLKEVSEQIDQEMQDSLVQDAENIFNALDDYLAEYFIHTLLNTKKKKTAEGQLIEAFKNKAKSKTKDSNTPKNLANRMKTSLDAYMEQSGIVDSILVSHVENLTGKSINANKRTLTMIHGYVRRGILQKLQIENEKINQTDVIGMNKAGYVNALMGEFREQSLKPAFDTVLAKFGKISRQTGDIKDASGKSIKEDLIIGDLRIDLVPDDDLSRIMNNLDINSNFTFEIESPSMETLETQIFAGVQSKSWKLPRERASLAVKEFFPIGHVTGLTPTGHELFFWHAGVRNVMGNLTKVFGKNNILYSTRDEIVFTCNLLKRFREQGYVFGFYKKVASNGKAGAISSNNTLIQAFPHQDPE